MELTILFILPLLYTARLAASQSDPQLANSLDIARNVSADFPSGSYTSNPIQKYPTTPYVPPASSTFKYWSTQPTHPTQSSTKYIPPCWTQKTEPTTAKPTYTTTAKPTRTTPRYTPPPTVSTTKYVPPCWTQTTTAKPTQTTPRYTPPPTVSTTKYVPPCWTQTTTAKPTQTTPRYTPPPTVSTTKYVPPCWTQTTTAKPTQTTPRYTPPPTVSTTKYVPPCWTQTTTAKPTQTTPRYTPPPTVSTTKYVPPCWTQTTTAKPTQTTPRYTPPTTVSTTKYLPPCWTQITTQKPPARTTLYPGLENFVCDKKNNFYSVPNECDTFIECQDNVARKHFCPEGLVYKPSTVWPAYPCVLQSEYKCLNGSITQPARPNAQCPHENGYYSVPNSDCSQYIVCEHGIATLMDCPKGLVFNEEISDCDWPVAVPSCHPDALKDFTCPSVDDANDETITKYRYYNSCKNYVACQNGFPRLLSCPAGLHFDQDQQKCVDESNVANCDA